MNQDAVVDREGGVGGQSGDIDVVLAGIWKDLLHLSYIDPDADFFEIGGDSLLAIRLLESIGRKFGDELLEPDIIYTASRFQDLADAIRSAQVSAS